MLNKVKPKPTLHDRMKENNPYFGKTSSELLDYLSGDNYRAPEKGTPSWRKFMYALMHAPHEPSELELEE